MQRRARAIDATLSIESDAQGTSVTLELDSPARVDDAQGARSPQF